MTMTITHDDGPSARRRALRGLAIPAGLLALWQISSHGGLVDPRILPPVEAVLIRFWTELSAGDLLVNLGASLQRNLTGFAIGGLAGAVFGTLIGLSRLADRLLAPSFNAVKQIAIMAWIPLISIWFGFGEQAKIVSWLATVAAEYFMSVGPGIGGILVSGSEKFEMDLVMLGVVILGTVGFALNGGESGRTPSAALAPRGLRQEAERRPGTPSRRGGVLRCRLGHAKIYIS